MSQFPFPQRKAGQLQISPLAIYQGFVTEEEGLTVNAIAADKRADAYNFTEEHLELYRYGIYHALSMITVRFTKPTFEDGKKVYGLVKGLDHAVKAGQSVKDQAKANPAVESAVREYLSKFLGEVAEVFDVKEHLDQFKDEVINKAYEELAATVLPFKNTAEAFAKSAVAIYGFSKLQGSMKKVTFQAGYAENMAQTIHDMMEVRLGAKHVATLVNAGIDTLRFVTGQATLAVPIAIAKALYLVTEWANRYALYLEVEKLLAELKKGKVYDNTWEEADKFALWLAGITTQCPLLAAVLLTSGAGGPAEAFVMLLPNEATGKSVDDATKKAALKKAHDNALDAVNQLKGAAALLVRESRIYFTSADASLASMMAQKAEADLVQREAAGWRSPFFAKVITKKEQFKKFLTRKNVPSMAATFAMNRANALVETSTIKHITLNNEEELLTLNPLLGSEHLFPDAGPPPGVAPRAPSGFSAGANDSGSAVWEQFANQTRERSR